MTRIAAPLFVLTLFATPLAAQDDDDGLNLMEEGARLFLRGLMTEMEPALRQLDETAREMEPLLRDFAAEMGPALADLMGKVEDWTLYHPPEMLENGDILLRRRVPLEPEPPETVPDIAPDPGEEIDL